MRVSVIIATYQRGKSLVASAESVLAQLPEDGELLIVDQTERYDEELLADIERIATHDRVHWIRGGPPSLPAARNFGLVEAKAPIVIFVDDDVTLLPGHIDAHLECFKAPGVVATAGRVLRPQDVSDSRLLERPQLRLGGWLRGSFASESGGDTNTLRGCNMAVRRTAALEAGAFDTAFVGNAFREDAEFASRVARQGRIFFAPDAALIHHEAASGGCRLESPETKAVLYRNEAVFFRKAYSAWLLPVWLVSLARRCVVCGPAVRERRVLASARAMARGVLLGLKDQTRDRDFEPVGVR